MYLARLILIKMMLFFEQFLKNIKNMIKIKERFKKYILNRFKYNN